MTIKAFELVSAIEGVQLLGEKAKATIECLECCGQHLYIGTSDSSVIHFQLIEKINNTGKIGFQAIKQGFKSLGMKKPVILIKSAPSLNHLLVLCDSVIFLLNMISLELVPSGAKVKSVTSFCLNEGERSNKPFSVEICVATKKKLLQVYQLTEDRLLPLKEVPVPELPLLVAMDNHYLCVAMVTQYAVVNYENGHVTDLFPYQSDVILPLVKHLRKEEFLLSGPSCLGMFVTIEGISPHPPLQWSDNLVGLAYAHPYVISVSDLFIIVHSILDQQQKQSIPFQGGRCVGDFEGRVFVASNKDIYALVAVPWEKQVQTLLNDGCVSEALDLARNSYKAGINKDKFIKLLSRIQQQAAFIELSQFHFDEARELFRASQVDVREIISLYPRLLPSKSSFVRSVPSLHNLADINQFTRGSTDLLLQCKNFLLGYLEEIRLNRSTAGMKLEVDTALLKLFAEFNSSQLIPLIISENGCDLNDCCETLELFGRYYALGLLHRYRGDDDRALQVWFRILDGEVQDDSFPGIEFVVEILANLLDHEIVWRYADLVLEKNQPLGVKIFIERPPNETPSERLRPEAVCEFLHRFPVAEMKYLEYLVFVKKLEKETFHTHLALLYLERVLNLKQPAGDQGQLNEARKQFQTMLRLSSVYRVQLILGKMHNTDLYAESAILYGKLEEHDTALRLLVHKLADYSGALEYCLFNSSGKDQDYRRQLFHILLLVYLKPEKESANDLISPALDLLNNDLADFETVKVLKQIPDHWSVGILSHFLLRSIRLSLHNCRKRRIERMLARGENIHLKGMHISLKKEMAIVTDDTICCICNRVFTESAFVRYPNGILAHLQCVKNRKVCPVTGKVFNLTKEIS